MTPFTRPTRFLVRAALALGLFLAAEPAHAFCGFYVSGAEGALYNDATQVVLMREGMRTVLSMQNNYQGPPEDFAMVVPVPVVSVAMVCMPVIPMAVVVGMITDCRADHLIANRQSKSFPEIPETPLRGLSSTKSGTQSSEN